MSSEGLLSKRHYSLLKDIPSLLHHKEREFDFRSVVKLGCASLEHKEAAVNSRLALESPVLNNLLLMVFVQLPYLK